jgi:nucleoside-diphosphate-sugar epimerase
MSRIVVTGGSGFIGTNLVDSLVRAGHEVINLDVKAPPKPELAPHWRAVDILDADRLKQAMCRARPDAIVHLAARTDLNGATVADYRANTEGVQNVIDAAAAASAGRVLFASSRLVCRIGYQPKSPLDFQPTTPYGESKVVGEQLVRAIRGQPFEWTIVRPTSIWGPWFHVPYRNFFDAIRQGRYVHPKGVRVRKSFGYVGNSVYQLEQLLAAPAEAVQGGMFYLADYEPIEVLSWGRKVRQAFGAAPIREVPMAALRALAEVGDVMSKLGWRSVPLTSFRLDNLVTEMLHDTSNLRVVCGDLPFDVDSGVDCTVGWMKAE